MICIKVTVMSILVHVPENRPINIFPQKFQSCLKKKKSPNLMTRKSEKSVSIHTNVAYR